MKRIAIVGATITEEELIERAEGYELWSVNNLYEKFENVKWSAWFELHKIERSGRRYLRRGYGHYPIHSEQTVKEYMEKINELDCPVYMQRKWWMMKKSLEFPFDDLIEKYGRYWGCSFAWMTAFAMEQGVEAIGYFGVGLNGNEYYYQRPSTEYLIGMAAGKGIEIVVDPSSGLLSGGYMYALTENPDLIYLLHGQFTNDLAHTILAAVQTKMEETF